MRDFLRPSWPWSLAALALAAVLLACTVCAFEGDHADSAVHGTHAPSCIAMAVSSPMFLMVVGTAGRERPLLDPVWFVRSTPLRRPDPPPKSA
jgi:hypothetical protein